MWVQQGGKGTSSDGEATGDALPKLLRRRNELSGEKVGLARYVLHAVLARYVLHAVQGGA